VPAGQAPLDPLLPLAEPVHRGVHLVGGGLGDAQVDPQGGVGPPAGGGQLGVGLAHPGDDQRHGQVPLGAGGAEQRGQPELAGHRPDRGDMPVRSRAGDLERLLGVDQRPSRQAHAQRLDRLRWEGGEVGEGLVADLAGVPVAAAQQEGDVLAVLVLAHNTGDMRRA
jgi:hypothetical protein